jgi:outer membrane murein-binding lipoprotein Lpp
MTLYEIDKSIEQLVNAVDPETGELMVDNSALDALIMERERKIENIACYIKNLAADIKALKDEETALAERRKAAEKKTERLREYLDYALQGQKFQTAKCAVSFRKSQAVELADDFIDWAEKTGNNTLLRFTAPAANKVAIKALLVQGAEIPGAKLVENTSVIIK